MNDIYFDCLNQPPIYQLAKTPRATCSKLDTVEAYKDDLSGMQPPPQYTRLCSHGEGTEVRLETTHAFYASDAILVTLIVARFLEGMISNHIVDCCAVESSSVNFCAQCASLVRS